MNLKQLSAISGIITAAAYTFIASTPFWPLVIALTTLSGYNLATATHQHKKD